MQFLAGFIVGAALVGCIWGYRGYLGRKAAELEQMAKDVASGAISKI